MTLLQYFLISLCVLLISAGQVMFKFAGVSLNAGGPLLLSRGFLVSAVAISIYAVATLMWIYLLRSIPLSVAYPFMALSYALVPAAAWLFFSENISWTYATGIGLIILGVTFTAWRA